MHQARSQYIQYDNKISTELDNKQSQTNKYRVVALELTKMEYFTLKTLEHPQFWNNLGQTSSQCI